MSKTTPAILFLLGLFFCAATANASAQNTNIADQTVIRRDNFQFQPSLRQPAVSEINGKADFSGGTMNSAAGYNFGGSITFPVTSRFGFQADGLYSRISNLNFYGGAGHFFWRDPNHALLGITGGYLYRDSFSGLGTYQIGGEGELYWRQFTFGFFGGIGSIDYGFNTPFIDTHPTRFVGKITADYNPLENLRVGSSFTSAYQDYFGKVEAEYQLPINGFALTGEAAFGNHGYDHWLLGVRYYFGGKKTLRDRQRQDDPPSLMPQILHSLGSYGAEFNEKANDYIAAHPSSGGSSGGGDYGLTITTVNAPTIPVQLPP